MKESRNPLYLTVDKDDEGRAGCLDYLIDILEQDALNNTILKGIKIKGLNFKFSLGYGKNSASFNRESYNSQNTS